MDFSEFRALTFDCYGTLIDWETGILDAVLPRIKTFRPGIEGDLVLSAVASLQALRQKIRPAEDYRVLLSRCYAAVEDSLDLPSNIDAQRAFGETVGAWPPFADTVEALQYLQNHFRLGILSNVDNASLQITIGRLKARFDVTVTAEEVGSYKPDPKYFHTAFKRFEALGISKSEILHVSQSKRHDIAPANSIRLSSVWINRRHDRCGHGMAVAAEAEPQATFTSLAELVAAHKRYLNDK